MKYFWNPILMACMLLGVLTACSDDNGEVVVDMLPKLRPITLTVEQQQMRDNNNEFACRLFRTINEQKDGDPDQISGALKEGDGPDPAGFRRSAEQIVQRFPRGEYHAERSGSRDADAASVEKTAELQ